MSEKPEITKPTPISGFPEWLPEVRLEELRMLDRIRATFESYGYCSIETPVVERSNVLLAKGGDTDREMYRVERYQADPDHDDPSDAKLGLRYDLTVPFARYVAQNAADLTFPFKRYQMQPSWRGERPQEGRYRQFTQCDIDVVGLDHIPLSFDAELPAIAFEALKAMDFGAFQFRVSNRKVLQGYLAALGVPDLVSATRLLDKLDKIGRERVCDALEKTLGLSRELSERCVAFAGIATTDLSFRDRVDALGVRSPQLDEGLDELTAVIEAMRAMVDGEVIADLSITRGFDYYTGTVYEARWTEFPGLGSICAGGRYDDLASSFTAKKLPGVGVSIGFTRIFGKLVAEKRLAATRRCPTLVLVTWLDAEGPGRGVEVAHLLRRRGMNVERYHAPDKLKKQLQYASRKGIPYVWFETDGAVKDMTRGDQSPADPETWSPPASIVP